MNNSRPTLSFSADQNRISTLLTLATVFLAGVFCVPMLLLNGKSNLSAAQESTSPPSQEDSLTPSEMLKKIIEIAKSHAIAKNEVDWKIIEAEMERQFADGKSIQDLVKPTRYLLYELGDYHGAIVINGQRFMAEHEGKQVHRKRKKGLEFEEGIVQTLFPRSMNSDSRVYTELLDDQFAYVEIPTIGGATTSSMPLAQRFRDSIEVMMKENPKGLIIDLRTNLGGNMHPMFAALGNVLPNLDLGGHAWDGEKIDVHWRLKNGNVYLDNQPTTDLPEIHRKRDLDLPIAVLVSRYTCSSGEAVASGLLGQKNIRVFGEHTSGFSTCNDWFPLSEEVTFSPAVGYYQSCNGTVHWDGVTPETEIEETVDVEKLTQGKTIEAAKAWIESSANGKR